MNCTSETIQGQIYIPAVNYTSACTPLTGPKALLISPSVLVAVIIVVAAFKDLTALTNAYGYVSTTLFMHVLRR